MRRGHGQHAAALAERGWPVFPCNGKTPRTPNGLKDATADGDQIARWWSKSPTANVAIATGAGLVVLDVDPAHGGDDALSELEREHGELPSTVEALTGGGGRHLYFRHPGEVRNSASKIGPGLDVRGDGGYVIAPPSVHASGRAYQWSVDGHPDDVELAEVPAWLTEKLRAGLDERNGNAAPVAKAIHQGRRNAALASLAGSMRRRGMSVAEIKGALTVANQQRCRPPLGDQEVHGIAASIGRYQPAAPPLEASDAGEETQEAAQGLSKLLALDTVGLSVSGARIVGSGAEASADLYLSNGAAVTFATLRDFGRPQSLGLEIAAATGALPSLNGPAALRAVSLLRTIAEHHQSATADEIAQEWGRSFLADADRIDLDMGDQAQRWQAFSRLRNTDPFADARLEHKSLSRACVVLVGLDGRAYVRTSWFRAHVRQDDGTVSPAQIANRMMRVGWERPGKEGRIKARQPNFGSPDVQCFYIVPPGWGDVAEDDDRAGEGW